MKPAIYKLSLIGILWLTVAASAAASDETEFQKAKKLSVNRQWDGAIEAFDTFLGHYPNSPYADDAQFWSAYCLEKKGDNLIAAYMAFEELILNYPRSPWSDDARMHQISLAETMVRKGNEAFKDFLFSMMQNQDASCRHHAALSLGRLGDKEALPVLESMVNDPVLGSRAAALIQQLESPQNSEDNSLKPGLAFETTSPQSRSSDQKEKKSFLYFETKRYKHYRAMLRNDDDWSREDLFLFGMWEILESNQFEELLSFEGFDRQEWIRKYWKEHDPTITTEKNEALEEFERRIQQAKGRYGERWNARHFRFLRDQFLRDGWLHAPWDARGQLYIRFGEPDYISPHGFQEELWEYKNFHADFVIAQYMTNIYGYAIVPGPLSYELNEHAPGHVEYNYIYKHSYHYAHDYGTNDFIENLYIDQDKPFELVENDIIIPYSIPVKEFKIGKKDGQSVIHFKEHVVIFNSDWRPVWQTHQVRRFAKARKKDWKQQKTVRVQLRLPLEAGEYMLAIRLEDEFRKDIGIFKMAFMIN